jgi:hypothetical protein
MPDLLSIFWRERNPIKHKKLNRQSFNMSNVNTKK